MHLRTFDLLRPSGVRRLGEVHVVDSVDDVLRRDHATGKVASVQTADGVLAALDAIELDVDLAVVVVECETDVNDVAVFIFALEADVLFKLLLPAGLGLPR